MLDFIIKHQFAICVSVYFINYIMLEVYRERKRKAKLLQHNTLIEMSFVVDALYEAHIGMFSVFRDYKTKRINHYWTFILFGEDIWKMRINKKR